jgi:uncharacterized membrane protein
MPELEIQPPPIGRVKRFLAIIRNRILTGLLIVIPTIISLWIAIFVYDKITGWSVEISQKIPYLHKYCDEFWFHQLVRMVSLVIIIAVLFFIGAIARFAVGQKLILFAERILLKVPMLNLIYSTTRQIGDALWSPKGEMFRQVVLFEYPRKGIYVIGFLTNENRGEFEINTLTGEELVSIFLPTTPNPTSGFLLFLPRQDCIFLKMDVATGMRLVISGGAVYAKQGDDSRLYHHQ